MNSKVIKSCTFFVVVSGLLMSGCTIMLPAHTNSNERTSEKISLTMLEFDDLCDGKVKNKKTDEKAFFWTNYSKAYPKGGACTPSIIYFNVEKGACELDDGKQKTFAVAGIAASVAIGVATDYIKKQLEKEKELYSAQYSGRLIDDSFWEYASVNAYEKCETEENMVGQRKITADSWKQRYIGFKLTRTVADKKDPASVIVYGFRNSADGRFMRIKPLSFYTKYAKAKVLSNQWFTWLPPTILSKLIQVPNESIDITIDVGMDAYYWSKKDNFTGPQTIAGFKTVINGYDMNDPKVLSASAGNLTSDSGWLLAPPMSDGVVNKSNSMAGNIKLTVTVTEKDTSEATKLLEFSEEWVTKGGDKLKSKVSK